ncbi:MAG: hypothetical protein GXO35_05795 [Gammaproteobacteria bacterium]|nr:hypothetical protein [Gammaproteobacteria bacterium]
MTQHSFFKRKLLRFSTDLTWREFKKTAGYDVLMNYCQDGSTDDPVVLFPDLSPEAGLPTGSVFVSKEHFYPFGVGVDIGCGYTYAGIRNSKIDFNALVNIEVDLKQKAMDWKRASDVVQAILLGNRPMEYPHSTNQVNLYNDKRIPTSIANYLSPKALEWLGVLSPGNHFIEIHRVEQLRNGIMGEVKYICIVHNGSSIVGAVLDALLLQAWRDRPNELKQISRLSEYHPVNTLFWSIKEAAVQYAQLQRHKMIEWVCDMLDVDFFYLGDNTHTDIIRTPRGFVHYSGVSQVTSSEQILFLAGSVGSKSQLISVQEPTKTINGISHGTGSAFSSYELADGLISGITTNLDPVNLAELNKQYRGVDIASGVLIKNDLINIVADLYPVFVYKRGEKLANL